MKPNPRLKPTGGTKSEAAFLLQGRPLRSEGQYFPLPAPLDAINIHVRGGHIIPQQVGPRSWRDARGWTRTMARHQHRLLRCFPL